MQYVLYLLLVAVIFGLVALGDFLLKKLFKRAHSTDKAVRMPRYSFILGLLMGLLGLIAVLYIPRQTERFLWLGSWVVLVIGAYLLTNFFWFGIYYDDEQFTYRALGKKSRTYRFAEITGQRTFVSKSGWNSNLYARGEEVQLYAAMQGLSDFLNKAFFVWCRENGFSPLKNRSFSEFLIANQKKYHIEHSNNLTNLVGRRVWGFTGIEPVLKLPLRTADGWQRDYSDDNLLI